MSTAELTTYTADDLLHKPDGDRFELVDGQLVEIDMGARSGWVGGKVYRRLDEYADHTKSGWAFPSEVGIQCFPDDPEKVRRPDAFFVCLGRFPNEEIPEGFVQRKVWEYLEAGVRLVWVINPSMRTVMAYRGPKGDASLFREQDELTGEDVLPGFRCRVAELFPPGAAQQ
jgi:Uma2 family endonuclease